MVAPLYDVIAVEVLAHYRLRLTFEDGLVGDVDLSHLRKAGGVFEALQDPSTFNRARVDPEIGTVTWPNGADLAPEVLYEKAGANPLGGPLQAAAG